jgi:uncharacterized membrane protein HdeD (DUF308 family)
MIEFWTSCWQKLLYRGLLAVVLGVLALVWPALTLELLVFVFGLYTLVDGGLMIYTALTSPRVYPVRGRLILGGIVGLAVGAIAVIWRRATGALLLYLLAFRALFVAVLDVINAAHLRREIARGWLLALVGVLAVWVALLLLLEPEAGLTGVVWLIGLAAIVYGLLLIALGWRLRRETRTAPAAEQ